MSDLIEALNQIACESEEAAASPATLAQIAWGARAKVCREAITALKQAEERISQLEGALREVEWLYHLGGNAGSWCPWCGREQNEGHAPDCHRQAALAQGGEK